MTARSSGIHFRPQKHILFSNSKLELSYARTYEGTNERTHTHTHTCHCDALVLVFGLWGGTWCLALRGKLYGLLAYFTQLWFFWVSLRQTERSAEWHRVPVLPRGHRVPGGGKDFQFFFTMGQLGLVVP